MGGVRHGEVIVSSLWNVYLPNAQHSVCLDRLSCTELGIYSGANSSRDMEGPKILKVGHVTPSRPLLT